MQRTSQWGGRNNAKGSTYELWHAPQGTRVPPPPRRQGHGLSCCRIVSGSGDCGVE